MCYNVGLRLAGRRWELMAEQGCPNEGTDKRLFGKAICFFQRLLTWSSTYEPISVLVAFPWPNLLVSAAIVGFGLPLWLLLFTIYFAINFPVPFSELTKWGVRKNIFIRYGWRYDFNAKLNIWPSAAIKDTSRANFY